jgi:glycine/D-amino acid oxidase-like deaminating enzyme
VSATTAPSPWLEEAGWPDAAPALGGDREADVCVVGAGYSGLSAAIALRDEGRDVVVVEAERAGFGASGRNAGHLTPTIGKDIPTLGRVFGRERVRGLLRLADEAIANVERLIERFAIDCRYEPVGNVVVAVHPRQHANLERAAGAAREFGVPGELLDRAELERRGIPPAFTLGLMEPHGGVLDPGRYVLGLRRAALDAGAELYEGTPVSEIVPGSPAVVRTPGGTVRARQVVVATSAYGGRLAGLDRWHLATYVQLFRTAPLTEGQREAVGWGGREGLYTAHEMLESYRLTDDQRIVGGAKLVRYARPEERLPDADPAIAGLLETAFRDRFPMLSEVEIDRHWGGRIAFALDLLPLVGRRGERGEVAHAIAYAGHGIALASYAGTMVADLLAGREGPGAALWTRRRWPLPPGPLRAAVFRGLTGLFGVFDRRADSFAWR